MSRPADKTFQPFIIRTLNRGNYTTEELYNIARARNLKLTRSRKKDSTRPSQFAWQHQLRRDQHTLQNEGMIARFADGTWGLSSFGY